MPQRRHQTPRAASATPRERFRAAAEWRPERDPRRDRFRCQAHDDRRWSGSLLELEDGRLAVKCHAGCTYVAVLHAHGLGPQELRPVRGARTGPAGSPAVDPARLARHRTRLANDRSTVARLGALGVPWASARAFGLGLDTTGRLVIPESNPTRGGWTVTGVLLDRLPDDPGHAIAKTARGARGLVKTGNPLPEGIAVVVEGWRTALVAHSLGLPAIGTPTALPGASSPSWWPALFGSAHRVVFVPDADAVGHEGAWLQAREAARTGAEVRIASLDSSRDDGWDLADAYVDLGAWRTRQALVRAIKLSQWIPAPSRGRPPAKREEGARWLRLHLGDGEWHRSADIEAARVQAGVSSRAFAEARRALGVESERVDTSDGQHYWRLRLAGGPR